ncbi:hypothetical protein KCU92_g9856, partial [Aureobasidium melanogenum]
MPQANRTLKVRLLGLSLLKDLINGYFNTNPHKSKQATTRSLNKDRLEKIKQEVNTQPTLLAIQLVLTHLSLTASPTLRIAKAWGFSNLQSLVYAQTSIRPIFKQAITHCLNIIASQRPPKTAKDRQRPPKTAKATGLPKCIFRRPYVRSKPRLTTSTAALLALLFRLTG